MKLLESTHKESQGQTSNKTGGISWKVIQSSLPHEQVSLPTSISEPEVADLKWETHESTR